MSEARIHKGYKKTEVGVIPEEWDVAHLGELFPITSSKRVFKSEWRTSGIPFYRARELAILSSNGVVDNELFISPELYCEHKKAYGVPEVGDLLVTGVGTLGKVFVVKNCERFYFKDGNIIWLKIGDSINPTYLEQLFKTTLIVKQIENGSAGTTVGTYTITNAENTIIPLPPLPEQRAIAEALSDVDSLLSSLDKLIDKKRAIKQGVMQELLTGKNRLPGFSGEWENKKLGEIGSFYKGQGIKKDQAQSSGIPCVRYGEIYTHHDDIIRYYNSFISREVALTSCRLVFGDLLFAGSGETAEEIGKCVAFVADDECYAGGDIIILRPLHQNSEYLAYLLNSHNVTDQKSRLGQGDAIVHIGASSLASIDLYLPPLPEQSAIAAILSDMDADIAALEKRRDKTKAIKQGMMQELLTGRIRLV